MKKLIKILFCFVLLYSQVSNAQFLRHTFANVQPLTQNTIFAMFDPINIGPNLPISGGGLNNIVTGNTPPSWTLARSTIAKSSGIWQVEFTVTSLNSNANIGILTSASPLNSPLGFSATGYNYDASGNKENNNSGGVAYGATYTTGNVIGVVLNLTTGTLTFYKGGVSQGVAYSGLSGTFYFACGTSQNSVITANFGDHAMAFPVAGANQGLF